MSRREARIAELVRPANGSSQPWFCVLDDGTSWLVKFSGAGPGREALFAEFVANRLGRLWGLPIPDSIPVYLDASVKRVGTDEFWDVLAASEGWNLAIRAIPNALDLVPDTDLPQATLESMLEYDALLVNWDRTAQSRNLLRDDTGHLWWIDHGSCRFLHHLANRARPGLPSTHFLFSKRDALEARSLPMIEKSSVSALLASVPEEWMGTIGRDRTELAEELFEYLQRARSVERRA